MTGKVGEPSSQRIESMLFSVDVLVNNESHSPEKNQTFWRTKSRPVTYQLTLGFGFLSTWSIDCRYSELHRLWISLRALAISSNCTILTSELIAHLNNSFPRRCVLCFVVSKTSLVRTRAEGLQYFIETIFNMHAPCLIEHAQVNHIHSCDLSKKIYEFFHIDGTIQQNIRAFYRPSRP